MMSPSLGTVEVNAFNSGGFTHEELKEIDDYAFNLGIEVFPCIQTLGHLGQILQWPRFQSVKDTSEVLLADCGDTYQLVEKMILASSSPFRSKRIHLGMVNET
jgi:N-acetyl-beta-hexosaminidase